MSDEQDNRKKQLYEHTLQVRVRSKNPLIERKVTPAPREPSDQTVALDMPKGLGAGPRGETSADRAAPKPKVETILETPALAPSADPFTGAPARSIYDRLENTEDSGEFQAAEEALHSNDFQVPIRAPITPSEAPPAKLPSALPKAIAATPKTSAADLPVTTTAVRFGGAALAPPPKEEPRVAAFLDDDETVLSIHTPSPTGATPSTAPTAPPRPAKSIDPANRAAPLNSPGPAIERGETISQRRSKKSRTALPRGSARVQESDDAPSPVAPSEPSTEKQKAADPTERPKERTKEKTKERDTGTDRIFTPGPKEGKGLGSKTERIRRRSTPTEENTAPLPPRPSEPTPATLPNPVPNRRLGIGGTKAAGVAVRRQMIDRIDGNLPPVHSPALKVLRGELAKEQLIVLDSVLTGEFDRRAMDGSISPKRTLEHLINERNFGALTVPERALLLAPIADDPADIATIKASIALLKTGVFKRVSNLERRALLDIFQTLTSETRARLAQLAARTLRGKSALEDRDFEDVPLLQHISALLSKEGFAPQLAAAGIRRDKLQNLILGALASPERLSFEEGNQGVLGMLEFGLAECAPAEFARLWLALTSKDMVAQLPGEGSLDLGRAIRAGQQFTTHQHPLRVGLAQLAQLAHPRARNNVDFIMPGGHGIDADIVSSALGLLYGVGFTVAAGAATALRHLSRVSPQRHRVPPVFVSVLYRRGERLFIFDRIEDGTMFLRAPHGRSTKRAGAFRVDPKRAVVSPELSIDSIPLDEFEDMAGVGLIPRT